MVLGDQLLAACAQDLALKGALTDSCRASPMHHLGLNSYRPGHGADIANNVDYAMSPHIDHAYFTVELQDTPGLQVQDEDGTWLSVPLVPDAVFVSLPDYLQRATNGVYRRATHRVGTVRAAASPSSTNTAPTTAPSSHRWRRAPARTPRPATRRSTRAPGTQPYSNPS
ncbi:hypothetical protein M4V62_43095 [Streptomyces durmitorensis]|uniref:Fe2OG dioxygenase domain-containing protein n=1 Tax=Streptomyces durmitorensis TaxID=319947 RepID=A0ABY4Q6G2_9ACTN|nr:2OG-Fe(II) oxygenase family protein [Streptomyces durmitorensis]UQT61316.1 hypothetical protein M4V62_43095 [Streptomyces durmitorensis]